MTTMITPAASHMIETESADKNRPNSIDEKPQSPKLKKRNMDTFRKNYDACRLVSMMVLTASFMLVELIFGFYSGSLALISDAFHMISDLQGLIIGFAAVQLSKRKSTKTMSYGWARAEIVGGLMNGCFLLAICGFIFMEAIERLMEGAHVDEPLGVIIVGGIGLLINVVGLFIFGHGHSHGGGGGHGHSHGSHGHSHGSHGHNHGGEGSDHDHSAEEDEGDDLEDAAETEGNAAEESGNKSKKKKKKAHENLNMKGVFLHVLGDALGSVGVVISGLIILFSDWEYRHVADAVISVIIAGIILFTTIPLVKRSATVLLQASPANVNMVDLVVDLKNTPGVHNIHDLHVWQLINQTVICSVHVTLSPDCHFHTVSARVKKVLHKHGIHSSTIQPEDLIPERAAGVGENEKCGLLCAEDCDSKQVCCTSDTAMVDSIIKRAGRKVSHS